MALSVNAELFNNKKNISLIFILVKDMHKYNTTSNWWIYMHSSLIQKFKYYV